jgi:AraC family transcriptional regulator
VPVEILAEMDMDKSQDSGLLKGMVPAVCDAGDGEMCSDKSLMPHGVRLPGNGWSSDSSAPTEVLDHGEFSVRDLKSVMTELYTALRSALNGEREIADESLRRAEKILSWSERKEAIVSQEMRGGLCPWQIRKVANHIEANLDRTIQNGDLASLVKLTPCYFGRAFRNSFGVPPHDYVIRRRVERAQGLMLSTSAPLSQIALDCGLSDQAHLSRLFRRIVGESPRTWRRARISTPRDA